MPFKTAIVLVSLAACCLSCAATAFVQVEGEPAQIQRVPGFYEILPLNFSFVHKMRKPIKKILVLSTGCILKYLNAETLRLAS